VQFGFSREIRFRRFDNIDDLDRFNEDEDEIIFAAKNYYE
jgi:hypothetical protein